MTARSNEGRGKSKLGGGGQGATGPLLKTQIQLELEWVNGSNFSSFEPPQLTAFELGPSPSLKNGLNQASTSHNLLF